MQYRQKKHHSGFALIESILSVGLIVAFISLFTMVSVYVEGQTFFLLKRSHGLFLAEEGLTAARGMRNADFASLSEGPHGLAIVGGAWTFSGEEETIGDYHRTVSVESLTGETKKVTATVSWTERISDQSISLSTILTHWK